MVNLGLPGSREASQELTDKPVVTDSEREGLEVILVVTEPRKEDRDILPSH